MAGEPEGTAGRRRRHLAVGGSLGLGQVSGGASARLPGETWIHKFWNLQEDKAVAAQEGEGYCHW